MLWTEIREAYPDQWLIVEALEAHTTPDRHRHLDRMAVVEKCLDGSLAMKGCRRLYQKFPDREFYFVHTSAASSRSANAGGWASGAIMDLELRYRLPFVSALLEDQGGSVELKPMLIDTGSASTVLSADAVETVGITPRPEDVINKLRGIGGTEVVYMRVVDRLTVGEASVSGFEVEVGGMDYGFEIAAPLSLGSTRRRLDLVAAL